MPSGQALVGGGEQVDERGIIIYRRERSADGSCRGSGRGSRRRRLRRGPFSGSVGRALRPDGSQLKLNVPNALQREHNAMMKDNCDASYPLLPVVPDSTKQRITRMLHVVSMYLQGTRSIGATAEAVTDEMLRDRWLLSLFDDDFISLESLLSGSTEYDLSESCGKVPAVDVHFRELADRLQKELARNTPRSVDTDAGQ